MPAVETAVSSPVNVADCSSWKIGFPRSQGHLNLCSQSHVAMLPGASGVILWAPGVSQLVWENANIYPLLLLCKIKPVGHVCLAKILELQEGCFACMLSKISESLQLLTHSVLGKSEHEVSPKYKQQLTLRYFPSGIWALATLSGSHTALLKPGWLLGTHTEDAVWLVSLTLDPYWIPLISG